MSTDVHVDWNHSAKQNIVNNGVNLPNRNARVFQDAESFYSIVTGQDMAKNFPSAIDSSIPELLRLEIALHLMKKKTDYFMPYQYNPSHMLMDRLCSVISECAFEVVPGDDSRSPLKLKEIPFDEYQPSNQRHISVHEVAFAAYGDSSSSKTPPPMLLFNLDTNKELRPATLRMKMAYESAKKREKMELMTRTAQRNNRRWSTPFVPFRTRAFNKLLETKCNKGQCHYPVVYSQDREMHELIIDAIAWRIDVILGKKDAMEHPYAIEQTFDSLMRFYKDSVNAWPICDGRGAMFTFDYTEVYDVEAFYKPYISTTDQSDAEKGAGKRYFLHLYRQKILSSFIENLDAADTEFETVYPIHGKGRIYDRSDSLAEKKVTMIDDTINIPAPDLTSVFETFEVHWSEVIDKFQVQSDDDV